MDQENIYHHVRETRRNAYPPTDHPEGVVHHPSDYDLSSNPDIYPYHHKNDSSYIHRQRSADVGADTIGPIAFTSSHSQSSSLGYVPYSVDNAIRGPPAPVDRYTSVRIPQGRKNIDSHHVLARMNNDFQQFAQNIGFENEKSTLANHSDIPVPDYPFVKPDQQPTDEVELPPPDSNAPRDEDNVGPNGIQPDERVTLQRNMFGEQRLSSYRYPYVYRDRPFMQLPQSNLIDNPKPHYLHIDSRDRNRNKYPNPNHYVIPLIGSNQIDEATPGQLYKDIFQISLISATIPVLGNPLDLPYIILVIDELEGIYDSASQQCSKAFGKLLFCDCGGKFLRFDQGVSDPIIRTFYPAPLASLSRLTIRFLKPDGTPFSWGTDNTPPTPINEDLQNSLTLQIVTKIPDVLQAIGHRNP